MSFFHSQLAEISGCCINFWNIISQHLTNLGLLRPHYGGHEQHSERPLGT